MVQCPNCNATVNGTDPFCPNCGSRLPQEEQPAQEAAYQPPMQEAPYQPPYQQPYQQPVYQQPAYQPAPVPAQGNGLGKAGMVLGIIAAAFAFVGLCTIAVAVGFVFLWIAFVLAVPGVALSIAGVCRRNLPKGKAVAGLVLNGIVLVLWVIALSALGSML